MLKVQTENIRSLELKLAELGPRTTCGQRSTQKASAIHKLGRPITLSISSQILQAE